MKPFLYVMAIAQFRQLSKHKPRKVSTFQVNMTPHGKPKQCCVKLRLIGNCNMVPASDSDGSSLSTTFANIALSDAKNKLNEAKSNRHKAICRVQEHKAACIEVDQEWIRKQGEIKHQGSCKAGGCVLACAGHSPFCHGYAGDKTCWSCEPVYVTCMSRMLTVNKPLSCSDAGGIMC